MAASDPTQPTIRTAAAAGASLYVHPSIRTSVWMTVSPYIDLIHRGDLSDQQALDEIRAVAFDDLAGRADNRFGMTYRPVPDSELRHIAACALALLERRVIEDQNR